MTNLADLPPDVTNPILLDLARFHINYHQEARAIDILNQMQFDDDQGFSISFLTNRARLYALAYDYDAAIADMNRAINLAPDEPTLYRLRGELTLLIYEWDAVLADYNMALALDPAYAAAYYSRGVLYYTMGPQEAALADFERYLELAPQGEHAEQATQYAEQIRQTLDALNK